MLLLLLYVVCVLVQDAAEKAAAKMIAAAATAAAAGSSKGKGGKTASDQAAVSALHQVSPDQYSSQACVMHLRVCLRFCCTSQYILVALCSAGRKHNTRQRG